jgi:hypothetical protein
MCWPVLRQEARKARRIEGKLLRQRASERLYRDHLECSRFRLIVIDLKEACEPSARAPPCSAAR